MFSLNAVKSYRSCFHVCFIVGVLLNLCINFQHTFCARNAFNWQVHKNYSLPEHAVLLYKLADKAEMFWLCFELCSLIQPSFIFQIEWGGAQISDNIDTFPF